MPTRPPVHRPAGAQTRQQVRESYDRWRGSARSRGYDARWTRVRNAYLAAQPLCQVCEASGRVTVATEVHHRVEIRDAPERRLDASNLVSTCHACHMAEHGRRKGNR
ncbi:HNH endonuclease [Roseicella sp. DB1501]|uniref:HNH endonuclease n=1 Tax=Roseicella sp. DB1501 TaxID=2730925 RepID=UPI001492182F|nr:HNH endonuclease signature motif containing protein [Roseicella sp. DB1501]NOG69793.1 HNH endonuclease [Roseicella sp. DB1501]